MIRYSYTGKPLRQVAADVREAIKTTLPQRVKIMAVDHFDKSFANQGFTDHMLKPWPARKSQKAQDSGRATLIKSGRLRRSIQGDAQPGRVIIQSLDVPYAEIHNRGGRVSAKQYVRPHTKRNFMGRGRSVQISGHNRTLNFTMPQRQFIGASHMLYRDIEHEINLFIRNAFTR